MTITSNHLTYFRLSTCFWLITLTWAIFKLLGIISHFYHWYFISSWNQWDQTSILRWKWILMFVTVILVPINHKYQVSSTWCSAPHLSAIEIMTHYSHQRAHFDVGIQVTSGQQFTDTCVTFSLTATVTSHYAPWLKFQALSSLPSPDKATCPRGYSFLLQLNFSYPNWKFN
jgi:hypothetical protein